jgi:hypothetical protein
MKRKAYLMRSQKIRLHAKNLYKDEGEPQKGTKGTQKEITV